MHKNLMVMLLLIAFVTKLNLLLEIGYYIIAVEFMHSQESCHMICGI